jgi:fructose-bisphosphate aldolase class II
MPLVNSRALFERASREGYAIGGFNVNNMEILQGIVDAAEEKRAPLILQVSAGARRYARHEYLTKLVEAAVLTSTVPIVLHLDHGEDFAICKACIDGGFTSVMIDGSRLPFEENVALTRQVVEYAHPRGVTVEAELGRLAGIEDDVSVSAQEARFTDPDQAAEFVARTGCDSLAIAIGTSHGAYKFKGEPRLAFDRLRAIVAKLPPGYPLVLHGASSVLPELVQLCNAYGGNIPGAQGVPEEMIIEARKIGIRKVNIDTDLRLAFTGAVRKYLFEHPEEFDPRKYLAPAREAIRQVVLHKLEVLGCVGKAD